MVFLGGGLEGNSDFISRYRATAEKEEEGRRTNSCGSCRTVQRWLPVFFQYRKWKTYGTYRQSFPNPYLSWT